MTDRRLPEDRSGRPRRFYLSPEVLQAAEPFLEGNEARHLVKVLRLVPGDRVVLFDGTGWEYQARIAKVRGETVFFSILGREFAPRESPLRLALGVPLIRPQPLEWILQKGTELGVSAFYLYHSAFSAHNYTQKDWKGRLARWQRIITEAAKQCGRNRFPELLEPRTFESLLETGFPCRILPYENETAYSFREFADKVPKVNEILAWVGPEGGFSPEEICRVREKGIITVSLGPRILRSETAALAVITLVQFLWGDTAPKKEGRVNALS